MNELQSFIDKKFKRHKTRRLETLISPLKHGRVIPRGVLVIMASGDTKLRLKILDKETPHKGFSTPLILNDDALSHGLTPNYLHWFLSREEVRRYLMSHATGSVILRVPKKCIYGLPVPIPVRPVRRSTSKEVILRKIEDPFLQRVNLLYEDYRLNVKHGRFDTAVILAGVISEAILYQVLLEEGVDKKLMDDDRSLGLGKLLMYLRLLKLDRSLGLPMSHLGEVQKKRNRAVHFGAMARKAVSLGKADLECFNQVISHFGI